MDIAQESVKQMVRETYRWLMVPSEEQRRDKMVLRWEAVPVSSAAPNLAEAIENKLKEEEWVVYQWSPIHLRNVLKQWYLKNGTTEISAAKVWRDSCQYLYLPRLANDTVFRDAVTAGVESEDYFAYASGKEGDKYLGFTFGGRALVGLEESSLLIGLDAAVDYAERHRRPDPLPPDHEPPDDPDGGGGRPDGGGGNGQPEPRADGATKKRFYGTTALNPVSAKMDFATIMDEVVQQFTTQLGVDVSISIEIEASSRNGFDEKVQRAVKENCNTLRFGSAEFDEDSA